jgi:hypothetical protein
MAIDMPDWNELPENIRKELVSMIADFASPNTPPAAVARVFYGLTAKRLGEFWPEWRDRKRREAASRDEDGA